MVYAVKTIDGQVELSKEEVSVEELATYQELNDSLCEGVELPNGEKFIMCNTGILCWHEEECELDFVKFPNNG